MKPEGWYGREQNFRIIGRETLMDFAQANGVRVWGHTLVWHSQTPDWFFQHDDGTPLTRAMPDKAILRARLHEPHLKHRPDAEQHVRGVRKRHEPRWWGSNASTKSCRTARSESERPATNAWYNVWEPSTSTTP